MTEYRPLDPSDEAVYRSYTRYAFSPQVASPDDVPDGPRSVGDRRGLFADAGDGRPLAVCAHHWFQSSVRGQPLDTPGVAAVATPPEHRRRGHARELLEYALEEYRDRGAHVAVLWPFNYTFYRSLGWEEAYRYVRHEIEPSALDTVTDEHHGAVRRVDADEYASLDAIYREYTADFDLAFDRDETWWRHRVFESWWGDHYAAVWTGDDGADRGYLVYRFDGDHRDRQLVVTDFGATDPTAYRQLWRYLADHDSQASVVTVEEPVEARLLSHMDTRAGVETSLHGGAMVRLVDVASVLEAIDYPPPVETTVVLEIADELTEWNDRTVEFAVADGDGTCSAASGPADASLDIGALSALVVGGQTAPMLAETGSLTGDDTAVEALDAAFPPRPVACRDHF